MVVLVAKPLAKLAMLKNITKMTILRDRKTCVNPKDTDQDLSSLYWIPKLHKNPYKERYIAGSSKCSTKPLSKVLTAILTEVKKDFRNIPTRHIQEVVLNRCGY